MKVDELFLKSQRNKIFETIQLSGFNPAEFEWDDVASSTNTPKTKVPKLTHKPSGYYCVLNTNDGKIFHLVFAPGFDDKTGFIYVTSFNDMLKGLKTWIVYMKREFEAPDLWSAIHEERKFAETASADEGSNEPFSQEEQKYISAQLTEMLEYLKKTQNLTGEKFEFVKKRLSYLEESAKRQGRRDWTHLVIGVLFTIVLELGLPGETARELFRFAAKALGKILGTLLALPIP